MNAAHSGFSYAIIALLVSFSHFARSWFIAMFSHREVLMPWWCLVQFVLCMSGSYYVGYFNAPSHRQAMQPDAWNGISSVLQSMLWPYLDFEFADMYQAQLCFNPTGWQLFDLSILNADVTKTTKELSSVLWHKYNRNDYKKINNCGILWDRNLARLGEVCKNRVRKAP